jgi:hypothetical protein
MKRGYRQIRSSAWLEHYTDNVGVSSSNLLGSTNRKIALAGATPPVSSGKGGQRDDAHIHSGGLAQLARASALHAEGHRFDSDILHRSSLQDDVIRDLRS